jgi:hypothetical protein
MKHCTLSLGYTFLLLSGACGDRDPAVHINASPITNATVSPAWHLHPAVGRLSWGNGGLSCTATLVTPRIVLSAGHCFDPPAYSEGPPNGPLSFVIYATDGNPLDPIPVSRLRLFGKTPDFPDDLALLLLGQDAPASVIPIPISPLPGVEGESVMALGLGCDAFLDVNSTPAGGYPKRGTEHTWSTVRSPTGTIVDNGWLPCFLDSGAPVLGHWQGASSRTRVLGVNSFAYAVHGYPPDATMIEQFQYVTGSGLADVTLYCPEINAAALEWLVDRLPCGAPQFLGSNIPASTAEVGWGSYQVDATWYGPGFLIGGEHFSKGIFAHAPSRVAFLLEGKYSRFATCVGFDDVDGGCSDGSEVTVAGDGSPMWSSYINNGSVICTPALDLAGVRELTLEATPLDNYLCDTVEWVNPRVTRRSLCEGFPLATCNGDCAWYWCAAEGAGGCFPRGTPDAVACPPSDPATCAAIGAPDNCTYGCAWYLCAANGAGACFPRGTPDAVACPPSDPVTCAAIGAPDDCTYGCAWYWCAAGGAGACFPRGTPDTAACPGGG